VASECPDTTTAAIVVGEDAHHDNNNIIIIIIIIIILRLLRSVLRTFTNQVNKINIIIPFTILVVGKPQS
jgi:hypothetical protein